MTNQTETQEKELYKDNSVRITDRRYVTPSSTYFLRNISSTYLSTFRLEDARPISAWTMVPALMGTIFGILIISFDGSILLGGAITVAAIFLLVKAVKMIISDMKRVAVTLDTNGGTVRTIVTNDHAYANKIVNLINEAIALSN